MKKILVISDNDLLNQLYLINLEIYIGAAVTIVKDFQAIQEISKNINNYDLIMSMPMLSEHDVGLICSETLKDLNSAVPLFLIGTPSKEIANATVIPSSYNLQNLLRIVASELGVTAKSMSEIIVPQYYPISLVHLRYLPSAPCLLYLQVKGTKDQYDYVVCSKKNGVILNLVTKLQSENIDNLFVNSLDRLSIVNKISESLIHSLVALTGKAVTPAAKLEAVSAGFSFAASQLIDNPEVVQEIVSIAENCSKLMDLVVSEVAGLTSLVQLLFKNQEGYIYTHSILVAYVAKHIVKNVTWGGDSHIERINFIVFFHDIFLVSIYEKYPELAGEEDLLLGNVLNDVDKNMLLNHARLAGEKVSQYKKCPSGVDVLIKQHHGISNGIGFASDFSDNISPLSKLFIVAEDFVEYYLREKKKNPSFKVNMKDCVGKLHLKYSKHTYRKIIDPLLTLNV
jgi:hypothetical protein